MRWRLDWYASLSLVGTVIKYLAATMLVPLIVAVVYTEDVWVFAASIAIGLAVGVGLEQLDDDPDMGPPEALLLV